jgi:glycosyltransferase involved in cell wall biosynthesis
VRQLRILMVLHMPWDRNLGGPQVQIELADEFRAQGHIVEKFDYFDAFPNGRGKLIDILTPRSFAARARDYVRRHGARFDVIDAQQGNLPFSKERLGFGGLLLVRTGGLDPFYRDFLRFAKTKWPDRTRAKLGTRTLRRWHNAWGTPIYRRSLEHADVIAVQNADEIRYVSDELGLGGKCILSPCGLSEPRARDLAAVENALKPEDEEVAFIGYWSLRKGSADWSSIIRHVRERLPQTRFAFLGTASTYEEVMAEIGPIEGGVRVVPAYESSDLPRHLASATLGAFPSYIEGFGIGVLEMLAAGLPTVAYDVPGPREMLRRLDPSLLVHVGDTEQFAEKILDLIRLPRSERMELASRCMAVAGDFRWEDIAQDTLRSYAEALAALQNAYRPVLAHQNE